MNKKYLRTGLRQHKFKGGGLNYNLRFNLINN